MLDEEDGNLRRKKRKDERKKRKEPLCRSFLASPLIRQESRDYIILS